MKVFIISSEKIITESIKDKVKTIIKDVEYEEFNSIKLFESYYIKKLDKEKYNEIVILDLFNAKEDIKQFQSFCDEKELLLIKQAESWSVFLDELNSESNKLAIKYEEFLKEQEEVETQRKITGPLHIYHKPEKEVVTKEVIKYVEVPKKEEVPGENKRKGFSFFSRTEKSLQPQQKKKVTTIIGIVGAERGAGATSLCVNLAEYLKESHNEVAILEKTEREELKTITLTDIDIYDSNLSDVNINDYDYVLIDFGIPFEIGKLSKMTTIISPTEKNLDFEQKNGIDMKYCKKIICVAPALPWKSYKLDFLINNPACDNTSQWIFLLNGEMDTSKFDIKRKIIHRSKEYLNELLSLI